MIIAFNYNTDIKPTLEIRDNNRNQVVIRLIPYEDEHLTIHLNPDGSFVRTHRSENKAKSVGDDLRVEAAAASGRISDPARHGTYIINTPLPEINNQAGYFLGGRLIDLDSFNPRPRYVNHIDVTISAPSPKFMLKMYLSTGNNPADPSLERASTSLGDICFKFESR